MAGFFMLQQFRWLRVVTYINLFLLSIYLVLIVFTIISLYKSGNMFEWPFGINFVIVAILIAHTALIISIQHRYYPDKEISRQHKLLLKTMTILSWIVVSFLLLGAAGLLYQMTSIDQEFNEKSSYSILVLSGLFLLILSMILQLAGGQRLRKTIERNSRQLLEDSFI